VLVALIGDVHDDLVLLHRQVERAAVAGAGAAIQLGDLGFREANLGAGRPMPRFPVPVLALCGNHEDHAFLRHARATGLLRAWAERGLCYQARGSAARLGGRAVVFLGGALHADRPHVREAGNVITVEEIEMALSACSIHRPDLIATHSCPAGIGIGMQGNPELAYGIAQHIHAAGFDSGPLDDCGEAGLRQLWDRLPRRPALWAFGHFHVHHRARIGGTSFVALPEPGRTIIAWDTADNSLVVLAD
jgi:hypothetical protein